MVKIVLLFFFSFSLHAANLTVSLSSDHVEMGKSITVLFEYKGTKIPEIIDLEAWQQHFFIDQSDPDIEPLEDGLIASSTKVKLYPRQIGDFTLDAIALAGSFVKPNYVTVKPSIRNDINATPIIHQLKPQYWADESIIITVDVPLHHKKNEVIAKDWEQAGFSIIPLKTERTETNVQLKWLIYTPLKGQYQLELPAIVQRGKGRFRFHSPNINLSIKPLPAYLPSSISSGDIDIKSQINTLDNNVKQAQITFTKRGYLPQNIEGAQTFLNQLSNDELSLKVTFENSNNQGTQIKTLTFLIPEWFVFKNLSLPIKVFNTTTGQIETIQHQLPTVTTLPVYAQWILKIIFLILCVILILFFIKISKHWIVINKEKQFIMNTPSATELRTYLLAKSMTTTLNEWALTFSNPQAIEIAQEINKLCYANSSSSIPHSIRKSLIILLSKKQT